MQDFDPVAADAAAGQGDPPPARRCVLVLNPHSRSAAEARPAVMRALEARGAELVGGEPQLPQALDGLLAELGAGDVDRVLVAGGDGTLNCVLRTLMRASVPVGILPLGTANDLARGLGLPSDPEAAVEIALTGPVRPIDVALVNGAPYVNVATIGLGPAVTARLTSELKARLGFLGYPRALISAYRDSAPFHADITGSGGQAIRLSCLHIAIGNGRHYGGGAVVRDVARVDDGLLHLIVLKPTPFWRLLLQAPLVLLGLHRAAPDSVDFDAAEFSIKTRRTRQVSADGEILAETPADFKVLPGALSVVVPPEPTGAGLSPR